jgi:transketolase
LGSAVAEVLAETRLGPGKRFKRIGIPDAFPDQYGSQESLMARYEITAGHVAAVVQELLGITAGGVR